jgi:hypothetical protein
MEYLLSHLDLVQRGVELLLVMWAVLKRADKALLLHLRTSLEPRLQGMDEKLGQIHDLVRREQRRRFKQHKRLMRLEGRKSH